MLPWGKPPLSSGSKALSPWPFSLVVLLISDYLLFDLCILQPGISSQDQVAPGVNPELGPMSGAQ